MGLSVYAEIALMRFLGVFIVITIPHRCSVNRRALQEASMLPLDDGTLVTVHTGAARRWPQRTNQQ
jgi:kynurenine formamidase